MKKHTPGPWIYQKGVIMEACYNGFNICDVSSTSEVQQDEANGTLMAAAPELLDACKAMIALIGRHAIESHGTVAHKLLLSAVAKAEGEK